MVLCKGSAEDVDIFCNRVNLDRLINCMCCSHNAYEVDLISTYYHTVTAMNVHIHIVSLIAITFFK